MIILLPVVAVKDAKIQRNRDTYNINHSITEIFEVSLSVEKQKHQHSTS